VLLLESYKLRAPEDPEAFTHKDANVRRDLRDGAPMTVRQALFEAGRAPDETRLFSPRRAFCEAFLDKWTTCTTLDRIGVGVPGTALASEVHDLGFPCVVKPRRGRGSRGFALLHSAEELAAYLVLARREPADFVIQEALEGTEYTVSVVAVDDGRTLAVVPKRIVSSGGSPPAR
jgi:carbamoyl-phosphate synthase large subunit